MGKDKLSYDSCECELRSMEVIPEIRRSVRIVELSGIYVKNSCHPAACPRDDRVGLLI